MLGNLLICFCSGCAAWTFWTHGQAGRALACCFCGLCVWQLYCAASRRPKSPTILELGGFRWDLFSFCRGWLITGQVGTGKTAGAINTMLWQVSKNCPGWGGLCVDDKGLYWETLSEMLGRLGRASDLILLQVRPENAGPDWKPATGSTSSTFPTCHTRPKAQDDLRRGPLLLDSVPSKASFAPKPRSRWNSPSRRSHAPATT